jgi:mRNA interferase RelE/StbE
LGAFNVEFTPAAVRDLKRLDPAVRLQLLRASTILKATPYPGTTARIKVLVGITPRHYRLRVGDYRIVYRIEESQVIVVRVAHRREAYQ